MSERAKATAKAPEPKKENSASQTRETKFSQSIGSPVDQILFLQRTVGNQAVEKLLKSGVIQGKLTIGQPGDIYEQEADRVADEVMRMPEPTVQRQMELEEEEEETVQTKSIAEQITPLVQRQVDEVEKEQEVSVQTKLLSDQSAGNLNIQRKCAGCASVGSQCSECAEEDSIQRKPFVSDSTALVQRQEIEEEEEELVQTKKNSHSTTEVTSDLHTRIQTLRGGGQPLSESIRAFFEPKFGQDFSQVRAHTDSNSEESAKAVNAKSYTVGQDIVFGAGQYAPEKESGKKLLAHELTHVVQQNGANAKLQRQHVPDTGFRYTPPATVTRSIVEIQGIVGTTPDGVYGENTRIAVEKYQTKLKAVGFYSDTLDGKWGKNTEAAHVAFAIAPNVERRGYNCAGFAFKDYKFHDLAATKAIYSSMTGLPDCSKPCKSFQHKFWLWEFNLQTTDLHTGAKFPVLPDFHTVGGQTNSKGEGPDQVMSKNGQRPVEGPKPPLDWELKSGPAPHPITGSPSPRFHWTVSGTKLTCFCNDKLP